jgi:hypothetical protein
MVWPAVLSSCYSYVSSQIGHYIGNIPDPCLTPTLSGRRIFRRVLFLEYPSHTFPYLLNIIDLNLFQRQLN